MPPKPTKRKAKLPNFVPVPMKPELEGKIEETLQLVRALSEHVLKRDPGAVRPPLERRSRAGLVKCTQETFYMLPGLVGRAVFQDWTGMSSEHLSEEVKAGRITVYKATEHGHALYYKKEIARLTGFKL